MDSARDPRKPERYQVLRTIRSPTRVPARMLASFLRMWACCRPIRQNNSSNVNQLISDRTGRFHFSSLIRCTVERFDTKKQSWEGSGGGMLDGFVKTSFGSAVAGRCASRFLRELPSSVRLIVMFGSGTKLNYVESALALFRALLDREPGLRSTTSPIRTVN